MTETGFARGAKGAALQHDALSDAPQLDLILLGLNTPGVIKVGEELTSIPVGVLSTSATPTDIVSSYGGHANAYVVKAIDLDDFDWAGLSTPLESEHTMSITPDRTALTDAARLAAVRRYEILDAPTDGQFDTIAAAAAAACGTPIATVSIVDADRVWFAAAKGLDGVTQVGIEPGLCASAFCADGPYVVNDAVTDPRTLDHPLVRGELALRFYAAAPIVTTDGHHLGTVTAIDATPRELTEAQRTVLGHLADQAAQHLELRLATITAVRAERELRDEAEQRAAAAAELATRMRAAAASHAARPHPEHCQLGGARGCTAPAELKIADSWGDSAWGCTAHVEEAIINVRSVFIASEKLGGLTAYLHR